MWSISARIMSHDNANVSLQADANFRMTTLLYFQLFKSNLHRLLLLMSLNVLAWVLTFQYIADMLRC